MPVPVIAIYATIFFILSVTAVMILMISVYKKRLSKHKKEKQEFEKEILLAEIKTQEKVFNEIGAELHDNINQMLSATRLRLNMTLHNGSVDEKSREHIQESEKTVVSVMEEIRKLTRMSGYHIMHYGLEGSITNLVNEIRSLQLLTCSLEITGKEFALPNDTKISIYRIIQESLNNILKHADAQNVAITLFYNEPSFIMTIRDDGKGFDINSIKHSDSYGLKSMKNRASSIHATIDLKSQVNGGTTIKLTI